jgi:hypothetical protein
LQRLTSAFILGYHGCDQHVGEDLLTGNIEIGAVGITNYTPDLDADRQWLAEILPVFLPCKRAPSDAIAPALARRSAG